MNKKAFTGCPKCQAEVSRIKYGDMEIEFCPNCKGFFMDSGELSRPDAVVFEDRDQEVPLDAGNLDKLRIQCPKCGVEMLKHKATKKAGPILDVCPSCKGAWFDQGEFKRSYKDWKGIKGKKQKIPLKLLCTHCSLKIESKYSERHKFPDPLKCPQCGTDLSLEFVEYRSHAWIVYLVGFLLLGIAGAWVSNYWTEHDDRQINQKQPIHANEMIYGGSAHVRIEDLKGQLPVHGLADASFWTGLWSKKVGTGHMIEQQRFYYYKGISGNQLLVEYDYSDSEGDRKKKEIGLPLSSEKAYLKIPALPGVKSSDEKTLVLTVLEDKQRILAEQM